MIRTIAIYTLVLLAAEFGHKAQANEPTDAQVIEQASAQPSSMQGEVIYADMKPVKADGKDVPPMIMDFTKNPDADQANQSGKAKRHYKVSEL